MGDLLFSFTEWLRTTPLVDLALWISETKLSAMMATNFWAIPFVQVVHILSIAAAFGSILMINVRIFKTGAHSVTLAETADRYVPWIWWSLLLLVISGLIMIIGEPVRELINPIFWIKMVLIIVAVLLSRWFHNGVIRRADAGHGIGGSAKAGAIIITILWCAIIFGGRWIAYAPA